MCKPGFAPPDCCKCLVREGYFMLNGECISKSMQHNLFYMCSIQCIDNIGWCNHNSTSCYEFCMQDAIWLELFEPHCTQISFFPTQSCVVRTVQSQTL